MDLRIRGTRVQIPTVSNRQTRNKPTHLQSINLQQGRQEYTMEKRQVSSASGAEITGQLHVKE